ncbi:non-ribosomal peptide synthetase [Mycobacterium parmense]|uniref:Putative peptide synthetase MbtE n=1 Tax=Mycobacterium parmense TaxID=185642 RepID=A0A7I7YN45_9MYCO|nr:non-ribosomal peptide synthetase [Mycobacterium parmense]MCV7353264.1 non-ribosomal peptide synthetase [Mycobacterium parmense]ORW61554.1 non-ribosomal peptide synthetase [Mycobacterium parmense]BBZ43276.1 putative peptide synthetase MbtE [Mycobacterium parmense]
MADHAKSVQERRRELLRRRIAESGAATTGSAEGAAIHAGQRYPLSPGQRRMWFLQAMDAQDVTLNVCVSYRLTGAVDEARLRGAFNDVVARHAILRTTYGVDSEGEPYQVFAEQAEINWRRDDLTLLTEDERERRIEDTAREEFGRPFDLTAELALRVTLLRTGAAEFVLLLTVHHICWDDDCWAVFAHDLSAAYNGRAAVGSPPQFVAVQVLCAPTEPTIADVGYWAEALRPAPEPVELPGAAAAHPSRTAERRTRALPAALSARVHDFARNRSASPFMVLLAAFGVLVRRYTGAPDFLVSVPVTQRQAAAEGAIGYFGNTLLLRLAPRPQDTFASFVDAVRETCLNGFAHQSVGIDRVVREVNPERMGRDGMDQLVRLGFSLRKSAGGFTLDGVDVRQLELGAVAAHLPLALAVVLDPDEAAVEFEYQVDVLGGELVEQMLVHYLQLLDNALADPGRPLTRLDMLGAGEREAVLAQSHGELVATPPTTMVAMLEAAANAVPEKAALVCADAELTYGALHRRANRLARRLVGEGYGADDIIGLRMTTSVEFIVAMLAVLKAGAAYLPIDPAYPADRIEYLVADARPRTVLGRDEFDAAERAAARLADAELTDADRTRPLSPEHLAYVIYTSGSTGRPKGVAVSHRAIAEHVDGFIAEWSMTAEDRLLQSSSVSFDASLLDIFVTLCLGAQLIVPRPDAFSDVGYVADIIDRHRVTVLHMVPSMLSTLLLLPQARQWRALRHVPVGGEALPGEVADRFANHFDAELRNHYGPTEAVVCATHMRVEGPQGTRVVPIGVPNRNVFTYVLDEQLQPVPAEVIGELYLGGAQLARGYLGRPRLTAERFVADPFNPGMRLYRTGDLVRRRASGELEFVGRADEQVKVRGFRIELGEVESVIARHPAVGHCLVVTEDTDAGPLLAAYLVPAHAAADLDLDEIRAHAAASLPEYMVPSAFAVIPEIPLTVSGKLDKRALPAPTPVLSHGYREPVTATERRICSIFAQLFGRERGLDRIGADDSFFGLGGHSLLAARLVARIRAEFGVECNVRAVFDTPTPAGLARQIERLRAGSGRGAAGSAPDGASPSRPQFTAAARPERPPLSYSQLAMWFHYRMRGPNDVFNMALALHFSGPLDIDVLTEALNDVVARHEALRTNFGDHEGVPYQRVHPSLRVEPVVITVAADQVDDTIAALRRHVFALESEPLIRPTLLSVDAESHVLLLLVHHIVTDHSSLGVVFDDLVVAYRARLAGTVPQWSAPAPQFADYAVWQRNTFDTPGEWGQAELAFWRDALADLPADISVATDRARPLVLGRRAEVASFAVRADRRAALTRLAEQTGSSEFTVYQAALAVVLHKLGGGPDIVMGSPVASRVDLSTAELAGPCANVVVLRTDLSGALSLRDVVARSRDTVLNALAHQEFPIERLVEALNPPRSSARNHPLFQNSIHFQGEDWALVARELTPAGETTVRPGRIDFDVSLLDLNVSVNVTRDGGLDVRVVANADLYDPATVGLIAEALDVAFGAFATAPDTAVSALELLPATDLAALSAPPAAAEAHRPESFVGGSPRTERALIALLEELLDVTGIDREDNFFAVGGDSIVSVQLAARATAQGLALTPAMVFETMSIAELAAAVDAATDAAAAQQDPGRQAHAEPMSASGLDADALARLTASWQRNA